MDSAGWQLHRLSVAMYGVFWSWVWWVNSPFTCSGWLTMHGYINDVSSTLVDVAQFTPYSSDSQPGFRGTLGFCDHPPGVLWDFLEICLKFEIKTNEHVISFFKYIFSLGVPWDFFLLNGFRVAKKVEKHCSRHSVIGHVR